MQSRLLGAHTAISVFAVVLAVGAGNVAEAAASFQAAIAASKAGGKPLLIVGSAEN